MKQLIKSLLLLAAAVMTTACEMDKLSTQSNNEEQELGYLRIGQVTTNADTENSELNGGDMAASRAVTAAPESYYLEIVNVATKETVWTGTIQELNNLENAQVGVEPGKYVVYAYQDSNKMPTNGAAVDGTYYAGYSEEVEVKTKQTSSFKVTCKLANILATVELSADLKTMFKADDAASPLQTVVKVGAGDQTNAYTYAYTSTHEAPKVYFKDVAGPDAESGNTLTFTLTGLYYTGDPVDVMNGTNIDDTKWKEVKMEKNLTNVRAAQWRKVSIDIDHNTTGDVQFVINIESLIYDEEIVVDLATLYADATELGLDKEEAIPDEDEEDPAAPDVTIDGQTDLSFAINSSIFDADAQSWTKYLKVNITPKDGTTVKQVYAEITSEDASLISGLAPILNKDGRIEFFPNNAASTYANVAEDGTKVTLNTNGMDALYRHDGTHTVKVYTVDSDNRMKTTELTITVTSDGVASNGPTVVWMKDGVDVIDQWHTLTSLTPYDAVVDITTDKGLKNLIVDISDKDENGDAKLTAEELAGFGLATHMDLINPESAAQEEGLRSLGFLPTASGSKSTAYDDDEYRIFYPTKLKDDEGNPHPLAGTRKEGVVSPLYMKNEAQFVITDFTGMLWGLYGGLEGEAIFQLTAIDAEGGQTIKQVKFKITNAAN